MSYISEEFTLEIKLKKDIKELHKESDYIDRKIETVIFELEKNIDENWEIKYN